MRVGLVIERFDPRRGGAELSTVQFATQLAERGHQIHVVARRFGEVVHRLPIIAHLVSGGRTRVGFAEAAEAELRSLSLDLVHDMGSGWYCDVFQPHGGSPVAVSRQKLLLLPRWMRPIKRAFNRLTPRYREFQTLLNRQCADDGRILVALSQMTAEHFQQFHGVKPERIRLIYNGVDTRRFSPAHRADHRRAVRRQLGVGERTVVLLIVAHNFALKGVPTLLRAMGRLTARRAPVHLVVVGGKRTRRWTRRAERLGAAGAVTFTGPVEDTVPWYAAADVYVHPAFYDNCSLVVLEALASGLPVVTSRLNGAGELLTEGVEGYIVSDPADADELLDRLEPLWDPDVRQRMGQSARQLALNHTSAQKVDQILAVYQEVSRARRQKTHAA